MDDDFQIVEETNLKQLFEIIEETNYDVISGKVGFKKRVSTFSQKDHFCVEKKVDGFCYSRSPYDPAILLPGYPNCRVTDITTNYFIARTSSAGTVSMDKISLKFSENDILR